MEGEGDVVGDKRSLVQEPRRRDVDVLVGAEGGGGGVQVELRCGVVPSHRKSGESVNLGVGPGFTRGYHWS